MKYKYYVRFLLLSLAFTFPAYSQPLNLIPSQKLEKEAATPNSLQLAPDWWKYFEVDEPKLSEHIKAFLGQLDSQTAPLPPESKDEATPLIKRAASNLQAYQLAKNQPLDELPPVTPIPESYRVDDILKLNRDIRNREIILQSDQEDLKERLQQIQTGKDRVRQLQSAYNETEPRSKARLIQGLKLINYVTSLELAKEKQRRLEHNVHIDEEILKQKQKEMETARMTIASDRDDLKQMQQELDHAENLLEQKSQNKRQQEANSLAAFDFTQSSEKAKLNNELLDLKLSLAAIEEAIAINQTLVKSIQLEWVQYLNYPTDFEFQDLVEKAKDWNDTMSSLRQKMSEWEMSIGRDIQRAQERLALNVNLDDPEAKDIRKLQEQILDLAEQSRVLTNQLRNDIQDSNFLLGLVNQVVTSRKGGWESFLYQSWETAAAISKATASYITTPLFHAGKTVITVWTIVKFIVVILAFFWLARIVRITLKKFAIKRTGVRLSLLYRVNRLFQYFIIVIGVIVALSVIGFDFSNFVLIAGALGVGLGFGLQTLFYNFVSGIVILFENQLKVGDYLELESGVRGEVKEINVRSTYIKTNDGIAVMVPNSELTTGRVINWTHKEPFRRVRIHFGVSYDSDKELVKKVVKEAVMNVPITLKKSWVPEPRVFLDKMGPSSLDFKVMVWVDDTATKRTSYTHSTYLWAIHDALTANNIKIPYPQMDIHIENVLEKETVKDFLEEIQKEKK